MQCLEEWVGRKWGNTSDYSHVIRPQQTGAPSQNTPQTHHDLIYIDRFNALFVIIFLSVTSRDTKSSAAVFFPLSDRNLDTGQRLDRAVQEKAHATEQIKHIEYISLSNRLDGYINSKINFILKSLRHTVIC